MRLLIVGCELGPVTSRGGLEVLLQRWAQELGTGMDVTLGSIVSAGDEPGTHRVPGETYRRVLFKDLDELHECSLAFDVVSLHQWFDWVSIPERTLLMLHSSIEECYRDAAAAGFVSPQWQQVVQGLQRPRTVATCARWASDTVEHHTGRQAVTLYPGISATYHDSTPIRAHRRRRVVACSGRMTTRKGVDVLLDLVEDNALGDLVLEVSSLSPEPALLQRAERLAAAGAAVRVIAPFTDEKEHAEYLRNVAVVAAPSILEGFGMIAVEAQAVGVPVIGAGAGGLLEAVLPGGGALVPVGAREELAVALREYSHRDVPQDVRAAVREEFSVEASAERKRAALLAIAG
jgi:glycosyltransferase involved in cell wall biosynthesis